MKNRVVVSICGQSFTLMADEDEAYIRRVAARVDKEIGEIAASFSGSAAQVAVLAAVNLADEAMKAQAGTEGLRAQIKDMLEETTRCKAEIAELRRELSRMKK